MHILLYGNGWIAGMFKDLCEESGDRVTQGGRISDIETLYEEVRQVNPDRVVCMIGRTHGEGFATIDYLEQKGKLVENINDNLYAPLILAEVCKRRNIHMTYLGTGCIFTYDDEKVLFEESDKPNFFGSAYSTTKGFTDRLMHDLYDDSTLNVRIRMPIDSKVNPRNFITKIVNYKKICSIPNSMSVLNVLLPLLLKMIEKKETGTINLTNPGAISHNEILEMYKEIVDPDHTWKNFSYEEQMEILAAGRSNNELGTDRLSALFPEVPDIRTAVRDVLYKYKESLSRE